MDSEKGTEEKVHCKRNENLICETEDSKAGVLKKWECRAEEKVGRALYLRILIKIEVSPMGQEEISQLNRISLSGCC